MLFLSSVFLKGHETPLFQLTSSSQSFGGCGMAITVIANVPCISTVTKKQWKA